MPGAKLTSLKITPENILDTSVPLHAELKFTATGLTANGDDKSIVSLPWITKDLGVANRILIGSAGLAKRKYPLETEVTCGVHEDISLKLTGGFAAPMSIPEFASVNDDGLITAKTPLHERFAGLLARLQIEDRRVFARAISRLKHMLKDMAYDGAKISFWPLNPIHRRRDAEGQCPAESPVDSDAKILDSHKTLAVTGRAHGHLPGEILQAHSHLRRQNPRRPT